MSQIDRIPTLRLCILIVLYVRFTVKRIPKPFDLKKHSDICIKIGLKYQKNNKNSPFNPLFTYTELLFKPSDLPKTNIKPNRKKVLFSFRFFSLCASVCGRGCLFERLLKTKLQNFGFLVIYGTISFSPKYGWMEKAV